MSKARRYGYSGSSDKTQRAYFEGEMIVTVLFLLLLDKKNFYLLE
jgi:hypothetical protein